MDTADEARLPPRGIAATDTIVALATPPGRGAVGIVRLSGPRAFAIGTCMAGTLPQLHRAALRDFRDATGKVVDRGLVLCFAAPHSYTGEDVVELQGHGGQVVTDLVLQVARKAGARQALPGEFSRRAYLNDRMDLAQAEAVADLIDAATEAAARAAQRSLAGEFSRRVAVLEQAIVDLRVRVEGALDFSEEDANWYGPELERAMEAASAELISLLSSGNQGRRLIEGYVVAIAGQPNVGKSTLLNRLAGTDAAIVTDIPGTTRDPLREDVDLGGLPVSFVDTAGLRDSADPIEREGVVRARRAFERCELILYLVDARSGVSAVDEALLASLPAQVPRLVVRNKLDLAPAASLDREAGHEAAALGISAVNGAGIDALVRVLRTRAGMGDGTAAFSMRSRHLEALRRTQQHLFEARQRLGAEGASELAAEELRLAQHALGEICGEFDSEQLLDRIFAGFCIGK